MDEWIKMLCVHTHTHSYYSVVKKKEKLAICKTMNGFQSIMLSEIGHAEKEKYCVFLLT